MQLAPQPKPLTPLDPAATLATAPFIRRAAAPPTPPHPSPAPTSAPQREKATSQCRLPPTRRAPTATGMETRRRRCSPKVRLRAREETTLCTARLTLARWRVAKCIIIMVSKDVASWNSPLQSYTSTYLFLLVLFKYWHKKIPCCIYVLFQNPVS